MQGITDKSPSPSQGEGRGEGEAHPRNLALVGVAKNLRRRLTDTEKKLWYYLRDRRFENLKFRRQYPVGRYVVDFICVEKSLIIELDGGGHAGSTKDKVRDEWLAGQGYRILRFWNNDVLQNMDAVLLQVQSLVADPHPALSLKGRGEVVEV